MNKNPQPCLACQSSQACKPVPVGPPSILSTVPWRCERERRQNTDCISADICTLNTPLCQPGLLLTKLSLDQCSQGYWRGQEKGESNLVSKGFECNLNKKKKQKQNHNEPNKIRMVQVFYLILSKSPARLSKYLMCFTKIGGKNRAKSGMKVLKRVFALRCFRQSALCVRRIAVDINNSGDVERQGLHIALHRSHADRKAQRVLRKQKTDCFLGSVCRL